MKNFYIVRRQVLLGISALLCTTLLLFGCQDQAIPVAPHADDPVVLGKKPGGGGGSQPATLDIAFPMETTGLAVTVGQDSRKKFQVSNNAFVHDIQMNFNDDPPCFTWNYPTYEQKHALVGELSKNVQSGNITMTIDKTGLVLGDEGTQSSPKISECVRMQGLCLVPGTGAGSPIRQDIAHPRAGTEGHHPYPFSASALSISMRSPVLLRCPPAPTSYGNSRLLSRAKSRKNVTVSSVKSTIR